MRAGHLAKQATGYAAFIPTGLPPTPPIKIDAELARLLSDADWSLGRLDGIATVLPNPDLFVSMYVRQEAVLSSQIEGTQSTLEDVLQFEIDSKGQDFPKDIHEVINYVAAMDYGLDRLKTLPLSLRLIREIHGKLLTGVRGANRTPGEFRKSQNWIGPSGCTLATATFVPPPVPEMQAASIIWKNSSTMTPYRCSFNAAWRTHNLRPSIRFLTVTDESDDCLSLFCCARNVRSNDLCST